MVLEAVLASLQGQWMQQIFLGGIKVADPVTSAVTKSGSPVKMAQICEHSVRNGPCDL